jgi:hypothetical protein
MPQAKMSYRAGPSLQVTGSVGTIAVRPRPARSHGSTVRVTLTRLLAAVVNGSDHPSWRTPDPSTQLALLPPREQNRLLETGGVPGSR